MATLFPMIILHVFGTCNLHSSCSLKNQRLKVNSGCIIHSAPVESYNLKRMSMLFECCAGVRSLHAGSVLAVCVCLYAWCYIRHVWRWRRQEVIGARHRERGVGIISVGAGTLLKAFKGVAISRSNAAIQTL